MVLFINGLIQHPTYMASLDIDSSSLLLYFTYITKQ